MCSIVSYGMIQTYQKMSSGTRRSPGDPVNRGLPEVCGQGFLIRKLLQTVLIRINQLPLFQRREFFDGGFPLQGSAAVRGRFKIDRGDRQAAPGILAALTGLMRGKAAGKIVGPARVQGVITAAEHVHHRLPGQGCVQIRSIP